MTEITEIEGAGSERRQVRDNSPLWVKQGKITACFTFQGSSLRVREREQWEINTLIIIWSTRFFYTHRQRLLKTSDKTISACQAVTYYFIYLHNTVKCSISPLYTDPPHSLTITWWTICMAGFPWKCVLRAALGSSCANGFGITLNFKEHTYQLPKVTVKMSCLDWKNVFLLPAG